MNVSVLSDLYGALAAKRRRWYHRRPEARRQLARPVVSVGALTVGGSGKTPVVGYVAELLLANGERPAVLSRGYRRTRPVDGVVVVRDPCAIRAGLAEAGDEPLMLARRLSGTSVLVSEDRYLAGRLAETRFDASVHLLDDGFQHLSLNRDVDLVVIGEADVDESHTLPTGRLRERTETVRLADALVVEAKSMESATAIGKRLGVTTVFRLNRQLGAPRDAGSDPDTAAPVALGARVLAVVGIARPTAFIADLRRAGYDVAATFEVQDHHAFSAHDVAEIMRRAESTGVDWVITTEKDMVRLVPHAPFGFPLVWVPLTVTIEPADGFRDWLITSLMTARATDVTGQLDASST